jgi:hypothetical protein
MDADVLTSPILACEIRGEQCVNAVAASIRQLVDKAGYFVARASQITELCIYLSAINVKAGSG